MNIVQEYHPLLREFKNRHVGEVCYIFGSGPSFNDFKPQEEGIFIGCNHSAKSKYLRKNMTYYFFGHGYNQYTSPSSICGDHRKEVDTLGNHILKFCMVSLNNNIIVHGFTPTGVSKLSNIAAIPCDMNLMHINKSLDRAPFLNHSIVFPATQLALYAGFKRIYLVGCDCHAYGQDAGRKYYFSNNERNLAIDCGLIEWWKRIYQFKRSEYPDCEMVNVNPVGLRGVLDSDIYTKRV